VYRTRKHVSMVKFGGYWIALVKARLFLRTGVFCLILLGVFSTATFAQLAKDLQWANELVSKANPKNNAERAKILGQILERLRPYRNNDAQLNSAIGVLELQLELLSFDPTLISGNVRAAMEAQHPSVRDRHLKQTRLQIVDRFSYLISNLDPTKISSADAQKISNFVKYTSHLIDDLRDPSFSGGRTSYLTRLATRINGIAKLAQSVEDPGARRILGGLRNTVGTIERGIKDLGVSVPNPMKSFDIPGEVAAAIIDTSRKGMDESSAALNEVAKAIGGDASALNRLSNHAKQIESILSPQNYGRQMTDALAKRVTDRLPFVRTLANWFATDNLAWLLGKWKYTGYHRNSGEEFVLEFRRGSDGVSGYIKTPNKRAQELGFGAGDQILRNIENDNNPAPYEYRAHAECLDRAGGSWSAGGIQFNGTYRILESAWNWCLTPVRVGYFRFEEGFRGP